MTDLEGPKGPVEEEGHHFLLVSHGLWKEAHHCDAPWGAQWSPVTYILVDYKKPVQTVGPIRDWPSSIISESLCWDSWLLRSTFRRSWGFHSQNSRASQSPQACTCPWAAWVTNTPLLKPSKTFHCGKYAPRGRSENYKARFEILMTLRNLSWKF